MYARRWCYGDGEKWVTRSSRLSYLPANPADHFVRATKFLFFSLHTCDIGSNNTNGKTHRFYRFTIDFNYIFASVLPPVCHFRHSFFHNTRHNITRTDKDWEFAWTCMYEWVYSLSLHAVRASWVGEVREGRGNPIRSRNKMLDKSLFSFQRVYWLRVASVCVVCRCVTDSCSNDIVNGDADESSHRSIELEVVRSK